MIREFFAHYLFSILLLLALFGLWEHGKPPVSPLSAAEEAQLVHDALIDSFGNNDLSGNGSRQERSPAGMLKIRDHETIGLPAGRPLH